MRLILVLAASVALGGCSFLVDRLGLGRDDQAAPRGPVLVLYPSQGGGAVARTPPPR